MIAVFFGVGSAISLGIADYLANRNSVRIGADRTLCGMLAVGTVGLSLLGIATGTSIPLEPVAVAYVLIHGVCLALALLTFFAALARGPVSVVAPIVGAHPVIVVAFAVVSGRTPDLAESAAIAAIIVGVVLIGAVTPGPQTESGPAPKQRSVLPPTPQVTGSILVLAGFASVVYAIAVITGQEASARTDGFVALWMGRTVGFLFLLALLLLRRRDVYFWRLPVQRLGIIVAHGFLDTFGFFLLFAGGMTRNPEFTAVISSTFSVVTVILACVLLGERMARLQIFGLVLIVSGVAMLGYAGA